MFLIVIILFLFVLLLILFYLNLRRCNYWKRKGIPFYKAESIFSRGIISSILLTHSRISKIYKAREKSSPCFGFFQIRTPTLLICCPELVYNILIKNYESFSDKRQLECVNENSDPLSQHLLALNGTKWKCLRSKLSPTFTSGKLKSLYPLLQNSVNLFITKIYKEVNTVIDVKDICGRLSASSIVTCAFGIKTNCIDNPKHKYIEMGKVAFKSGYWLMLKVHLRLLYPKLFKYLGLSGYEKKATQFYCSFIKELIENRERNQIDHIDFLQLLIKLKSSDKIKLITSNGENVTMDVTDNLIAAQTFSFFVGGYETTSATLCSAIYELASHTEVKNKLRDEIKEKLLEYNQFSYNALNEMSYMDQIISEVLRLHPPVFYIPRVCTKTVFIPEINTVIDKNTEIIIPILELQKDKRFYDQPDVFLPERFDKDNKDKIPKGAYLPFGDGPRKCLGMRFSIVQIKLALARILAEFDIELDKTTNNEQLSHEEFSRVLKIESKLMIKFTKLENK